MEVAAEDVALTYQVMRVEDLLDRCRPAQSADVIDSSLAPVLK